MLVEVVFGGLLLCGGEEVWLGFLGGEGRLRLLSECWVLVGERGWWEGGWCLDGWLRVLVCNWEDREDIKFGMLIVFFGLSILRFYCGIFLLVFGWFFRLFLCIVEWCSSVVVSCCLCWKVKKVIVIIFWVGWLVWMILLF